MGLRAGACARKRRKGEYCTNVFIPFPPTIRSAVVIGMGSGDMTKRAGRAKGQAAIEFLMTYGWAIVLMLAFVAVLYYMGMFDPSRIPQRTCVLPSGLSCTSFKMMKNTTGIYVLFSGFNGLDYDIGFDNSTAVMSAENVGGMGRNNYTGTCSPSIVKKGKLYTCRFNVSDTTRIPGVGDQRRIDVYLSYKDCEANSAYSVTRNCSASLTQSHALSGQLVTQMEQYSAVGGSEYCGNGQCDDNLGETTVTCPGDCTPHATYVQLGTNVSKIAPDGTSKALLIATVYDQFGSVMAGQSVLFTKNGTTSGSISPPSNATNSSGIATSVLTSNTTAMTVLVNATANGTTVSAYWHVRYAN